MTSKPESVEALGCPSCGNADVDFERRAAGLVRCGLCGAFIEVNETSHLPARDGDEPDITIMRGRPYSPTPPRKGRIISR